MRRRSKYILLFWGLSIIVAQNENPPELIIKEFTPAGRIEALVVDNQDENLLLIQLDLKNDSLFALINDILPDLELYSGPASYHRIMATRHFNEIQSVLTDEFYSILIYEHYKNYYL